MPDGLLVSVPAIVGFPRRGFRRRLLDRRLNRDFNALGRVPVHEKIRLCLSREQRKVSKQSRRSVDHCAATIKMRPRIASWRDVPEDPIVASSIMLPNQNGDGRRRPVVELAGVAQRPTSSFGKRVPSPHLRSLVNSRRIVRRSEQECARLLAAPPFETALKRAQQFVGIRVRIGCL